MTSGQKVAASLLTTVVVFAIFTVIAFTGLFSVLDTRFFEPSKVNGIRKQLDAAADASENYISSLIGKFSTGENAYLSDTSVLSYFESAPSDENVQTRALVTGNLFVEIPGLDGIRIVASNGRNLHFSSYNEDLLRMTENMRMYKDYNELQTSSGASEFEYTEIYAPDNTDKNSNYRLTFDSENNRIIFAFPFYDIYEAYRGSIFFYINAFDFNRALAVQNLVPLQYNCTLVSSDDASHAGFVFGLPAVGSDLVKQEIIKSWQAGSFGPDKILSTSEQHKSGIIGTKDNYWVLLTSTHIPFFHVAGVYRDSEFAMLPAVRILLLVCVFTTLFLIVFMLFSLKSDDMVIIRDRIKRFQYAMINEYFENREKVDWAEVSNQIAGRKHEVSARIKKSLGKRVEKHEAETDELLNRSWDEIIAALGGGVQGASGIASLKNSNELKNLLEEILSSGNIKIQSENVSSGDVGFVSSASPAAAYVPEEIVEEIGDVDAADEIEEIGDADVADTLEDVEEIGDVDAADEIEEIGDADVADTLEDVEEIGEEDSLDEVEELKNEFADDVENLDVPETLDDELEPVEEVNPAEDDVEEISEEVALDEIEEVEAEAEDAVEPLTEESSDGDEEIEPISEISIEDVTLLDSSEEADILGVPAMIEDDGLGAEENVYSVNAIEAKKIDRSVPIEISDEINEDGMVTGELKYAPAEIEILDTAPDVLDNEKVEYILPFEDIATRAKLKEPEGLRGTEILTLYPTDSIETDDIEYIEDIADESVADTESVVESETVEDIATESVADIEPVAIESIADIEPVAIESVKIDEIEVVEDISDEFSDLLGSVTSSATPKDEEAIESEDIFDMGIVGSLSEAEIIIPVNDGLDDEPIEEDAPQIEEVSIESVSDEFGDLLGGSSEPVSDVTTETIEDFMDDFANTLATEEIHDIDEFAEDTQEEILSLGLVSSLAEAEVITPISDGADDTEEADDDSAGAETIEDVSIDLDDFFASDDTPPTMETSAKEDAIEDISSDFFDTPVFGIAAQVSDDAEPVQFFTAAPDFSQLDGGSSTEEAEPVTAVEDNIEEASPIEKETEDAFEVQEIPANRSTFSFTRFEAPANIDGELPPYQPEVIFEDNNGIFRIAENILYDEPKQNDSFKNLVDSVLK